MLQLVLFAGTNNGRSKAMQSDTIHTPPTRTTHLDGCIFNKEPFCSCISPSDNIVGSAITKDHSRFSLGEGPLTKAHAHLDALFAYLCVEWRAEWTD